MGWVSGHRRHARPDGGPDAGRRARPGIRAFRGGLLALVLVAATAVQILPTTGASATASAPVSISATRSASGTRADALSRHTRGSRAVWRSAGSPTGVALITRFSSPTRVDGARVQGAGAALRIRSARMEFSDGSAIVTTTDGSGSRSISFPSRRVRWVRLVASSVRAGQAEVGLAGWWFHRGSSARAARAPGDAALTARITASSGRPTKGGWTADATGSAQWLQLGWKRSMELSAVRIFGGGTSRSTSRTGYLQFSDGSRIVVGTLEPLGGSPTTIAFTPRMTKMVRFVATGVPAGQRASVRRMSVWTVGVVPPEPGVSTPTFRASGPTARSCSEAAGSTSAQLVLLCPSNGSRVRGSAHLVVSGPVGAALQVVASRPHGEAAVRRVATGRVDFSGLARLTVPMRLLTHGPTAVRITAPGVGAPLYVQLENLGGVKVAEPKEALTKGMDLKFDEDFDTPVSVTRNGCGAGYASGKPNSYGVDDFGDAIFAQPTSKENNLGSARGFLRITGTRLKQNEKDSAGYGRRYVGGLLSSAHLGGSGFSAQYGYFEARILAPAGKGTWPAFWLMSAPGLVDTHSAASEVDVAELYGHNPRGVGETIHDWRDRKQLFGVGRWSAIPSSGDTALRWHTYGALITPTGTTFTVDGRRLYRAPAVEHHDEPFFFITNLAMGGGWPVDLSSTKNKVTLYVDWVKVWV